MGSEMCIRDRYAAPPWLIWRMMGLLASRAASRDETTVEEEVTLIAGMAYPSDCACLKRL